MGSYDWSQFRVHMYIRAPRSAVFRAWATPAGLASFFIAEAEVTTASGERRAPDDVVEAGDGYTWTWLHPFVLSGTYTAVERDRGVAFTFGGCAVEVGFRDVRGAVEVAIHQTNCATEDPERAWQHLNCRSCWIYFLLNLKSVLEQDADLRDRDEPGWNDSVSIGWDPTTA